MGLGIQPTVARATYKLNCLTARVLPLRRITVLTYHRIGTRREVYPENGSLAECTTEQFAEQMAWLRDHATPIDVTTADQVINRGAPCPNRAVLVTFDDGYRADMWRIKPILEQTGVRPVMFLPTDFIGTRRRFWWDRIGVCVQTSVRRRLIVGLGRALVELPLETAADRDAASDRLLRHAKWLEPEEREAFLAALEQAAGTGSTAESPVPVVIDWEEARSLTSVFDFGSHTMSHPLLSRTSSDRIRSELAGARATVEAHVGRPCFSFAIPFGMATDYTPELLPIAAALGVRLVFSLEDTLRAPQQLGETALVDRITLNAASSVQGLAAKVTWPQVFVPDWSGKLQQTFGRWLRPG
jgi:peptidoglycan/xylan/chitin deacetylase (PgdA/CDA1 family)